MTESKPPPGGDIVATSPIAEAATRRSTLSRRTIMTALGTVGGAAAMTSVVKAAAAQRTPAPTARRSTPPDPIIELVREHAATERVHVDTLNAADEARFAARRGEPDAPTAAAIAELQAAYERAFERYEALGQEIIDMPPTSPAGFLAKLRFMASYSISETEDGTLRPSDSFQEQAVMAVLADAERLMGDLAAFGA
jgi:hypothetical protein